VEFPVAGETIVAGVQVVEATDVGNEGADGAGEGGGARASAASRTIAVTGSTPIVAPHRRVPGLQ
jgi:hypothetical protein